MKLFEDIKLSPNLRKAIQELGFTEMTPVQEKVIPLVKAGKNVVGIAQTGTGKTLAYLLPILQTMHQADPIHPGVVVIVPTRELVTQVVRQANELTQYMTVRNLGVYGGANIKRHKMEVTEGCDILVATPGRLYDLVISGVLKLKNVRKLVIDEVDVLLDLGFRFQLTNILDLMPERRQDLMFSATMTLEAEEMINKHVIAPQKISIAMTGTRLENIEQSCYPVYNFLTKINLLQHLLEDAEDYSKVIVFTSSKKTADKVFELLEESYEPEMGILHSNKSQNFRFRSIEEFDSGKKRIMITTDVMARGLDMDDVSHVINFDTPPFAENYMHRIGRTGRVEKKGHSLLFYTEKEKKWKEAIEEYMKYQIPSADFPADVEINYEMTAEERSANYRKKSVRRNERKRTSGGAFHEKKDKNKKTNLGGSYRRKLKAKYKKPRTKGSKRK